MRRVRARSMALAGALALALAAAGSARAEHKPGHGPFADPPWPEARHAERTTHTLAHDIDVPSFQLVLARHLYEAYPGRVLRGNLPPVLHAVVFTEARLDASGQVVQVEVLREPAGSPEVAPWLRSLIERAAPYPVPAGLGSETVWWREVWLVDRSARLQAMSLSKGQR